MPKLVVPACLAALLACAGAAAADDGGIRAYLGGSVSQNSLKDWNAGVIQDGSVSNASADNSDIGNRLFAGLNLNQYASLELGYDDLGTATASGASDGSGPIWMSGSVQASAAVTGFDLSVIGKAPIGGNFSLLGRIGMFQWTSKVEATNAGFTVDSKDDGSDLLYGVGVQLAPGNRWRFRAEFANYKIDTDDVRSLSVTALIALGPAAP